VTSICPACHHIFEVLHSPNTGHMNRRPWTVSLLKNTQHAARSTRHAARKELGRSRIQTNGAIRPAGGKSYRDTKCLQ